MRAGDSNPPPAQSRLDGWSRKRCLSGIELELQHAMRADGRKPCVALRCGAVRFDAMLACLYLLTLTCGSECECEGRLIGAKGGERARGIESSRSDGPRIADELLDNLANSRWFADLGWLDGWMYGWVGDVQHCNAVGLVWDEREGIGR